MKNEILPCPCGNNCSLSVSSPGGGMWRVTAWPCGTQGPVLMSESVVTEEMAIEEWNAWVMGRAILKDDEQLPHPLALPIRVHVLVE